MAQWMKDLPYEHEGADLQHSSKKLGTETCDPPQCWGGRDERIVGIRWPASLAKSTISVLSERLCLHNKVGGG